MSINFIRISQNLQTVCLCILLFTKKPDFLETHLAFRLVVYFGSLELCLVSHRSVCMVIYVGFVVHGPTPTQHICILCMYAHMCEARANTKQTINSTFNQTSSMRKLTRLRPTTRTAIVCGTSSYTLYTLLELNVFLILYVYS